MTCLNFDLFYWFWSGCSFMDSLCIPVSILPPGILISSVSLRTPTFSDAAPLDFDYFFCESSIYPLSFRAANRTNRLCAILISWSLETMLLIRALLFLLENFLWIHLWAERGTFRFCNICSEILIPSHLLTKSPNKSMSIKMLFLTSSAGSVV